jgi:hypothetical protein
MARGECSAERASDPASFCVAACVVDSLDEAEARAAPDDDHAGTDDSALVWAGSVT